jgi:hypothetical protein
LEELGECDITVAVIMCPADVQVALETAKYKSEKTQQYAQI